MRHILNTEKVYLICFFVILFLFADNILRRSRLRRPIKHRRRQTQPGSGYSKAGASTSSTFLSPESSPLHHSVKNDSERRTSKEEDQSKKRNSDDMRPTCLGCGDYLPFILKGQLHTVTSDN